MRACLLAGQVAQGPHLGRDSNRQSRNESRVHGKRVCLFVLCPRGATIAQAQQQAVQGESEVIQLLQEHAPVSVPLTPGQHCTSSQTSSSHLLQLPASRTRTPNHAPVPHTCCNSSLANSDCPTMPQCLRPCASTTTAGQLMMLNGMESLTPALPKTTVRKMTGLKWPRARLRTCACGNRVVGAAGRARAVVWLGRHARELAGCLA